MSDPTGPETTSGESPEPRVALLLIQVWLLLAALGQVLYIGWWPMYLYGVSISRLPALLVALTRLGVYTGLACGLHARDRGAWAATVLELLRTVLAVLVVVTLRDWNTLAGIYPARWAQGLLSGLLPLVMVANLLVSSGWSPGPSFEFRLHQAVSFLVGVSGYAGLWLRYQGFAFGVDAVPGWLQLLRRGLGPVALITAAEVAAVVWVVGVRR